jgi:hypothetical protein
VATDLTRIGEKARKEPGWYSPACITTSAMWTTCEPATTHWKPKGDRSGWRNQGGIRENLEENLRDLSERLRGWDTVRGRSDGATSRSRAARKGRPLGHQQSWKTRLWKKRPNGRWNRSTRPYSKTAATDTDRGAASTMSGCTGKDDPAGKDQLHSGGRHQSFFDKSTTSGWSNSCGIESGMSE